MRYWSSTRLQTNMRALYYFPAVLHLSKWALTATLTITETQTLPISPTPTPTPATEQDTYITTTIFAYHDTNVIAPLENARQGSLSSAQTKIWQARPTGFVGGIDLIPVVDGKKDKQIKMSDDNETIQVGFEKNYFEARLADQKKEETDVQASSPYHLQPGYRGEESSEEQAKLEKTIKDAGSFTETPSADTTTSSSKTLDLSASEAVTTTADSVDSVHSTTLPTPSPSLEEEKIFAYDELDEITFWGSPKMNDNKLVEGELKLERLPDQEILERLVKQPYVGLEPGEKMPAPPVKKIMTDHLPPPLPTPSTSFPMQTDIPSTNFSSSGQTSSSKEGSKGKQVRFEDQDGKVPQTNGTTTSSTTVHTETKTQKLIREKLLNLQKNKGKLAKTRGSTPSSSSFSGRKADQLRSSRRKNAQQKGTQKSGSTQLNVSLLLGVLGLVITIW